MPRRAIVYVDGFNLYYGSLKGGPHKWLDLERYFTLLRSGDVLVRIHYFTAEVSGEAKPRQAAYLRALSTTPGVHIVLGKFKPRTVECRAGTGMHLPKARRLFVAPAEKRTDVNIGLQMLEDAYEDRCDVFVLVTGDSDLVPAVDRVRALFPQKQVIVYVPTRDRYRGAAVELRSAATRNRDLPLELLRHAQFPARLPDGSGGFIDKPAGW